MLGHSKAQGNQDNLFKVISDTLADADRVTDVFLMYCSRYQVLPGLNHCVGKDNLVKFLGIFGGVTIKVPLKEEELTEKTLLPEIATFFGEEVLERFLTYFKGTTVKIPPLHTMRHTIRDVDIYIRISDKRSADTVRELARHYNLTRHEVWWIWRRVATSLDPSFSDADFEKVVIPDEEEEEVVVEDVG